MEAGLRARERMMSVVRIAMPEVAQGRSAVVEVEGKSVLICRSASGVRTVVNDCPHQNLTMDGGRVRGESVICPHHGARFSLEDGRSLSPLTTKPLTVLPCRMVGDELEIDV